MIVKILCFVTGLIFVKDGLKINKTGGYYYWNTYVDFSGWQTLAGIIHIIIGIFLIVYSICAIIKHYKKGKAA